MTVDSCNLCDLPLPIHPILDGPLRRFCCSGCQAVYSILSVKGETSEYQKHPLFHQALRFGLISNPALLEQLRSKRTLLPEVEVQKIHFEIYEMWCPSCAELIRLVLMQEKGVEYCMVDYATDLAAVEFSPRYISKERIFELISALGYRPQFFDEGNRKGVSKTLYIRFIIAAFCSLNVMMFAYPLYSTYFEADQQGIGPLFAWLSFWVTLPVVTYAAWPILKRFWAGFSVGIFGMEALVVMGVGAGMAFSTYELMQGGTHVYFDSMCVIITFILLGKIIESRAKFSAKESLFRLNRSLPKRARQLLQDGNFLYTSLKELKVGDMLQVRMGETIVLDGVVITGDGSCNESLMTGEVLPVSKSIGSKVMGGSILQIGNLVIKITAEEKASTLHRIIEMIEMDIGRKMSYVRSADVLVRWFVPLVIGIALFAAGYSWIFSEIGHNAVEDAILRGITVLLISCPCALGIAAPLAESYLINALSRLGAIVRNRGALQYLAKLTFIAFDKTGTITEGKFKVISGLEQLTDNEMNLLAGLVHHSTHPISSAIASMMPQRGVSFDRIEEIAGKGLRGYIGGEVYLLGSAKFISEHGLSIDVSNEIQASITTIVYFLLNGGRVIKLTLGDSLRAGVSKMLDELKVEKILLLSGDAFNSVSAVASQCNFPHFFAHASPLDKREKIEQLKQSGEIICMVGDGINDAPALTAAHVGISMVRATDISIQVSDILLTTERLEIIPKILQIAEKGHRIIKQNLFWAFFYNIIGIGLAASGLLSPIFAAFAMVASSLIVLFNAQRLK